MLQINIRQATIDDAPFVATIMMEAVGMSIMAEGKMPDERLIDICRRTDTLYTYKNAVIAEYEGKSVGGLISYCGEGYHEVKQHTFSLVKDFITFDIDAMDDETRSGEYYLDSAAILPTYRGGGIGRQLIEYGIRQAQERHLLPILACDPNNTPAYRLYTNIGFREDGHLFIFGEDYLRMTFRQA